MKISSAALYKIRERLVGGLIAVLAVVLIGALFSHRVTDQHEFIGVLARMTEGLRVILFLLSIVLGLFLVFVGARLVGGAAIAVAIVGAGALTADYLSNRVPPGTHTDMTILWFNILKLNEIPPDDLEVALRESGADLVVLTEAVPARGVVDDLADLYPYRLGCETEDVCNLLFLSKRPLQEHVMEDFSSGPEKLARVGIEGRNLQLIAVHMVKPWYMFDSAREGRRLRKALYASPDSPLVVVGDFNAAPWSRRMRNLKHRHDLLAPTIPVPTWPTKAGMLGIPIDHALFRGGVRLTSMSSWGEGLGSNHRGLLFDVELPEREN